VIGLLTLGISSTSSTKCSLLPLFLVGWLGGESSISFPFPLSCSADPFSFPLDYLETTFSAGEGVSPLGSKGMFVDAKKDSHYLFNSLSSSTTNNFTKEK
jgi:hypothetical protein